MPRRSGRPHHLDALGVDDLLEVALVIDGELAERLVGADIGGLTKVGHLRFALLQSWKQLVDLAERALAMGFGPGLVGAEAQILAHAQVGKYPPALEYVRQAEAHDIVRRLTVNAPAAELDAPGFWLQQPRALLFHVKH